MIQVQDFTQIADHLDEYEEYTFIKYKSVFVFEMPTQNTICFFCFFFFTSRKLQYVAQKSGVFLLLNGHGTPQHLKNLVTNHLRACHKIVDIQTI